jgi:hypothetical protein
LGNAVGWNCLVYFTLASKIIIGSLCSSMQAFLPTSVSIFHVDLADNIANVLNHQQTWWNALATSWSCSQNFEIRCSWNCAPERGCCTSPCKDWSKYHSSH